MHEDNGISREGLVRFETPYKPAEPYYTTKVVYGLSTYCPEPTVLTYGYKTYTVKYLGNVVEGRVRHLNLPMEELKALAVAQLKAGEPVWFGSDCGKFGNRDDGIWDPDSFVYGELLGGLDLGLTKAERLDYRDSAMNHAMVLCGVNLDENGFPRG